MWKYSLQAVEGTFNWDLKCFKFAEDGIEIVEQVIKRGTFRQMLKTLERYALVHGGKVI